ncbi:hypothetical protein [Enterovirga rhinocerotis]|uniref:YD repeat-containing protein n=1 Tax=Enterovirga rhinocerotis TaxID=1339210 RepID=A0A4R7C5B2_9HYPH|nr:hypothetical protein [Enterovirga rhinocerotis]TDR93568.1 hypothetical protein EV668_0833 [Enterovirga rhinocerotis]
MKRIALTFAALAFAGGAVAQDTTTIKRTETPFGDKTTVTRETEDGEITRRSTETTGSVTGCETRSTTRTNEDGDTTSKTTTRC